MLKFSIEDVKELNLWDKFIESSDQGTIFSNSNYLNKAVENYRILFVRKGEKIKCGLVLIEDKENSNIINDDLIIYAGLIFSTEIEQKRVKTILERHEITGFIIKWLVSRYKKIDINLSPQVEDMRPFLWLNYHSENVKDKFHLDLRYTSYVNFNSKDLLKNNLNSQLFRSFDTLRKRNIREGIKAGCYSKFGNDIEFFLDSYSSLMEEQGQKQDQKKLNHMSSLLDMILTKNFGQFIITYDSKNRPIYSTIFCWDSKRAYYLFGAPAPGVRERYMGSIAFWHSFLYLAERGISIVDLEGVNSPKRGYFKMGFGGNLTPYYRIYKT